MDLNDWLTIAVPTIISIIGFVVTFVSLSKSFKNELNKQRMGVHIDKMSTIPYDILKLLDTMIQTGNQNQEITIQEINNLLNNIYAYGSEKAIQLAALMQKENYRNAKKPESMNRYKVMSLYILLATQIKYDVTGITISPEFWFQMRITDYENNKEHFKTETNQLIKKLQMRDDFLIK